MTVEELHFRRAINETPGDTALLLVFADWLEEQQDPRGELLRLMHDDRAFDEERLRQLLEVVEPVVPCYVNSLGMTLVYVPPGKFRMGSPAEEEQRLEWEGPPHEVTLTKGFYLGKYPVTQAEYTRGMGKNPSCFCAEGRGKNTVAGKDTRRYPVECVSWDDAMEFCQKLSASEGKTYRLPTEAEWEYACRGKTSTPFHFGSILNGRQANCNGNYPYGTDEKGAYVGRTTEVGSYRANGFGLQDMHGNVWEWCADWYSPPEYLRGDCVDPTGPVYGVDRVVRGGCWECYARDCRLANRTWLVTSFRYSILGFRLCLSSIA